MNVAVAGIVPARLAFTDDGTPWSEDYGDVYHSASGGLEQSRHVFLGGNDLPHRWRGRDAFVVLETGFGLGLNFLAAWQAWRDDPERCGRLHFVSVEKHPFRVEDMSVLHQRWPDLAPMAAQLQAAWPPLATGFHRLRLDRGRVTLTLLLGDAVELLPKLAARCDAFFLDGFAPARNAELWSSELLNGLGRLASDDATLATWSVAASVRDILRQAGWAVDKRPGFANKRDMLVARRNVAGTSCTPPHRRTIVIGAGIAGSSCAAALAARRWKVDLIERRTGPAMEASGNPAGVLLPMLAKDAANLQARFSRAAYFYAQRLLAELAAAEASPLLWKPTGILQIARDAADEAEQIETIARLGLPPDYVRFIEREAAVRLLGRQVANGGWLFPSGGWVSPPTLCRALIALGSAAVVTHFGVEVAELRQEDGLWSACDATGKVIAAAEHAILANADAARQLLPDAELPFTRIRGQVSILPGDCVGDLGMVVCRDGYLTPPAPVGYGGESLCCLGATFDFGDDSSEPSLAGHHDNLSKLEDMLPGISAAIDPNMLGGRVGFRTTTPDRLPLVGPLPRADACRPQHRLETLPRVDGLHCLLGYGARGMVWAGLAAELLAAQLENEPLPVEKDLVAALDPARFLLRAMRRGRR